MSTRTVHVWPTNTESGWSTWSSVNVNMASSSPGPAPFVPWRRITNANRTQAAGSSPTARVGGNGGEPRPRPALHERRHERRGHEEAREHEEQVEAGGGAP